MKHAKVKTQDLSKEIDEVLASKQLPTYSANDVDSIRHIGNFATHPIKSTNTGEIVDVEQENADWQLDVLEGLFDFYFIGPAEVKKKREALDKKARRRRQACLEETHYVIALPSLLPPGFRG